MTKYAGREPYPFKVGDNATGQCSDCGLVFYGSAAFDRHRRDDGDARACSDPAEAPPSTTRKSWWLDNRQRWHYGAPLTPEELARIAGRVGANPGRQPQTATGGHSPTNGPVSARDSEDAQ